MKFVKEAACLSLKIVLQIEECALLFRKMSTDTVTAVTVISNQWVESVIDIFEHLNALIDLKGVKEVVPLMMLIGDQAEDISKLFKMYSAWAMDLCGKVSSTQGTLQSVAKEITRAHQKAVKEAQNTESRSTVIARRAIEYTEEREEIAENWNIASWLLFWVPVIQFIPVIGSVVSSKKAEAARQAEERAKTELAIASHTVQTKKMEEEYAEVNITFSFQSFVARFEGKNAQIALLSRNTDLLKFSHFRPT